MFGVLIPINGTFGPKLVYKKSQVLLNLELGERGDSVGDCNLKNCIRITHQRLSVSSI